MLVCSSSPTTSRATLQQFPLRQTVGMIWIWADPATAALGESIPLPIFDLLERLDQTGGTALGFMRDLPYGYRFHRTCELGKTCWTVAARTRKTAGFVGLP